MYIAAQTRNCKHCNALLLTEEARACGTDRWGYECANCVAENAVAYDAFVEYLETQYERGNRLRCFACRLTLDELPYDKKTGRQVMRGHWKDGAFQILCEKCSDEYEKRANLLYHKTLYGAMKKLAGAK